MEAIGERIKQLRKELTLSQEKFGERVKVTKAYISHIENSTESPSDMLIKLISFEFGINEEWLRNGIGEKYIYAPAVKKAWSNESIGIKDPVNFIKLIFQYYQRYLDVILVLGPGGAEGLRIPLLDETDLINIVNFLQYRFSQANDEKEKLRIAVKFESIFPDFLDTIEQLNAQYLKKTDLVKFQADRNIDFNELFASMDEILEAANKSDKEIEKFESLITEINEATKSVKEHNIYLPCLGETAAGKPIEVNEILEGYVPVEKKFARNKSYLVKAKGDSMIEAGIDDGDFVVIHPQPVVENGEVALINIKNESTIKYLYIHEDKIELRPANQQLKPMFYQRNQISIKGKVVSIIKKEEAESRMKELEN